MRAISLLTTTPPPGTLLLQILVFVLVALATGALGDRLRRTGTALACLATLSGLSPREAVTFARANYDRHAVEVPWQRLFIRWFSKNASPEAHPI